MCLGDSFTSASSCKRQSNTFPSSIPSCPNQKVFPQQRTAVRIPLFPLPVAYLHTARLPIAIAAPFLPPPLLSNRRVYFSKASVRVRPRARWSCPSSLRTNERAARRGINCHTPCHCCKPAREVQGQKIANEKSGRGPNQNAISRDWRRRRRRRGLEGRRTRVSSCPSIV